MPRRPTGKRVQRDDGTFVVVNKAAWAPGCSWKQGRPDDRHQSPERAAPVLAVRLAHHRAVGRRLVTDADGDDRAGQLAVAVLKGQQLRVFDVRNGSTDNGTAVVTGQGRLRAAVEGPDGQLYIAADVGSGHGRILAVQPVL